MVVSVSEEKAELFAEEMAAGGPVDDGSSPADEKACEVVNENLKQKKLEKEKGTPCSPCKTEKEPSDEAVSKRVNDEKPTLTATSSSETDVKDKPKETVVKKLKLKTSTGNTVKPKSKQQTTKDGKTKKQREITNKKQRAVKDNERVKVLHKTLTSKISSGPKQTTLTQHFQVRRSERRLKSTGKEEERKELEQKLLSNDESHLEIRVLEEKGRGVFPKQTILKGDLVCEYAGDLIDIKEARQREEEYAQNAEYGCYMYYFEYKSKKYCIDATKESGRLGRLLNHSKTQSNVTTKLFPINNIPRLILVAMRDITTKEELLYDYGDRSKTSIESHPWLKS